MSYSIWLCSKRIIFFSTSQIFHFLNKVCEKNGKMLFLSHCVLPCLTPKLHRPTTVIYLFFTLSWKLENHPSLGHRYGLGVTSLLLTQRARVRSPVGSVSWLRFFPGFSLNRKTSVRKFGPHSSPVITWSLYQPSTDGYGLWP